MKCLVALIITILFYNISYGYEQIYYSEEEYLPLYIIKDYSYINSYNQLWQDLSMQIDLTFYDTFIHKDFGNITSRKSRDEVINFIKNYKLQTIFLDNYSEDMVYPAINSLILQNKALLKARKVLANVPDNDKTSLVYLVAGLSYIYSDGLYELDKIRKIFKEWLRLGGDDFPDIKGKEKEKRYKFFSYIANMPENPIVVDEFINILKNGYYDRLIFKDGMFDIFNANFYTIISSRESYKGNNITKYFVDYIKAEYMDIITNKHFRLDEYGKYINHYFTVWENKDGLKKKENNFYIFPFNQQTFILIFKDLGDKKLFKLNYYNPEYIDSPEYAVINLDNVDNILQGNTLWKHTLIRNKVINRLISSPSFVCKDNMTIQHEIICESFLLRMLDKISSRKYYLAYSLVKNSSKKSQKLIQEKEKFINQLKQCYIDRKCIQNEYETYINTLINF